MSNEITSEKIRAMAQSLSLPGEYRSPFYGIDKICRDAAHMLRTLADEREQSPVTLDYEFPGDNKRAIYMTAKEQSPAVVTDATLREKLGDLLGIGSTTRSDGTILANVYNCARRADCLAAIERDYFMVPGEPDEDFPDDEPEDECLLNWGHSPSEYSKEFGNALKAVAPLLQSPAVDHARVPDAVGEVMRNSAGQIYMQWFDKKTVADFVGRLIYASPTPGESHE